MTSPIPVAWQRINQSSAVALTTANSTTPQTVFSASTTDGSKLTALMAANTSTLAVVLNVILTSSAASFQLGAVTVPVSAGVVADTPTTDLLNAVSWPAGLLPVDGDGQKYLLLKPGLSIQCSAQANIATAGKQVNVFGHGIDF